MLPTTFYWEPETTIYIIFECANQKGWVFVSAEMDGLQAACSSWGGGYRIHICIFIYI